MTSDMTPVRTRLLDLERSIDDIGPFIGPAMYALLIKKVESLGRSIQMITPAPDDREPF